MTHVSLSRLLAGAGALALLTACGGDDDAEAELRAAQEELAEESEPEAMETAPDPAAAADAYLAENANRDGVRTLDSGLQIEVLEEGDGEAPTEDDIVRLTYDARLSDGQPFDNSERVGGVLTLASYRDLQLPGLVEALPQMREGERARLTLPPRLAFGEQGFPGSPVGPNEVMVFDIDLIEVVKRDDAERIAELQAEAEEANRARMAEMEAQRAAMQAEFEALATRNQEEGTAFLAEVAGREGIQRTDTGLLYEVVDGSGEGASPTPSDEVRVHYRGTLPDGSEFDSSYSRGQPTEFRLNGVIAGWTEGLQLMQVGDTYRFYLPADIAYGEAGTPGGPIGPNQALVFDVELLGVNPDDAED